MAQISLSEAETYISDSINRAKELAQQESGFEAMRESFAVILSVSEAINPKLQGNKNLVSGFVSEMDDKASWLVAPVTSPIDEDIAAKLTDIRDALDHQISLPNDVVLINDIPQATGRPAGVWFISPKAFVVAVERTAYKIIQNNPDATFDPNQLQRTKSPRGLATAYPEQNTELGIVGHSSASQTSTVWPPPQPKKSS